jgi:hypothetical protein
METSKPKEEAWNQPHSDARSQYSQENKRILTGVLAILFVLGYNNEGIIILVATAIGYATLCFIIGGFILTATSLLGLIEGIIYLTKSDVEFYETYQKNKKPWF